LLESEKTILIILNFVPISDWSRDWTFGC